MEDRDGNIITGGWDPDWVNELGRRLKEVGGDPKGVAFTSHSTRVIALWYYEKENIHQRNLAVKIPPRFQEKEDWTESDLKDLLKWKQKVIASLDPSFLEEAKETWENHQIPSSLDCVVKELHKHSSKQNLHIRNWDVHPNRIRLEILNQFGEWVTKFVNPSIGGKWRSLDLEKGKALLNSEAGKIGEMGEYSRKKYEREAQAFQRMEARQKLRDAGKPIPKRLLVD